MDAKIAIIGYGSIQFSQLEKILGQIKISKVIPSVTAEVNESQTLVCHNECVSEKDKIVLERILHTLGNVIERVATKGGITQEGTKVIEEKFPPVAAEIFEKTLAKRKVTTEKAIEIFGK